MKKIFTLIFLTLMLLFITSPTSAVNIQIEVDNVTVVSNAMPEIRKNRTMVPLRVVSESLGAEVQWSNSEIILSKENMQIKLQPNNNTISKNGETEQIDAQPYIKHGITFVPIRFIAETFDCNVSFIDSTVVVETKKLMINNQQVSTIQNEFHMTMGGIEQQLYGNGYIHRIYDVFTDKKGNNIEAPANYSWHYDIDTPGAYFKEGQFDFLDIEGNSIQRYDVYILVKAFPADILLGYPEVLIHDVTNGQWNVYNNATIQTIDQLFENAESNGFLKNISHSVV